MMEVPSGIINPLDLLAQAAVNELTETRSGSREKDEQFPQVPKRPLTASLIEKVVKCFHAGTSRS